jgi:uncharacterized membrane protein YfcA
VIGVQLGSWVGLHLEEHSSARRLKLLMAAILVIVAVLMLMAGER